MHASAPTALTHLDSLKSLLQWAITTDTEKRALDNSIFPYGKSHNSTLHTIRLHRRKQVFLLLFCHV